MLSPTTLGYRDVMCVTVLYCVVNNNAFTNKQKTSSVTAGFGRHSMPPPASNPYLWPFDLETGMGVASKVGNLPSRSGHARPLGSRIIRYVRDGRTDGKTDRRTDRRTDGRTKATLIAPFPAVGGITRQSHVYDIQTKNKC